MKVLIVILSILSFLSASQSISPEVSFNSVWNQVASDPLEKLPHKDVSYFGLYKKGKSIIKKDAKRTLNDHSDILAPFKKLAHPNGICFKGKWQIDTQNIYSGYFKKGSQALIIARASSAMSNTKKGDIRAFGFAGKLFPTLDKDKIISEHSANFFLIDDLGGTRADYYTDVELTNEPSVSMNSEVIKNMLYALEVSHQFEKADKHSTIRQLYEISELGTDEQIITPKWMKIEAKNAPKVDAKDFRDELKIEDENTLTFNIYVANKIVDKKKVWEKIGTINLDSSVVSFSCDRRLHFHHPKWRDDLNFTLP